MLGIWILRKLTMTFFAIPKSNLFFENRTSAWLFYSCMWKAPQSITKIGRHVGGRMRAVKRVIFESIHNIKDPHQRFCKSIDAVEEKSLKLPKSSLKKERDDLIRNAPHLLFKRMCDLTWPDLCNMTLHLRWLCFLLWWALESLFKNPPLQKLISGSKTNWSIKIW